MKAILVSVDYTDLLKITLPYNRHHFEQVWVVTTPEDAKVITAWLASLPVSITGGVHVHATTKFYDNGAIFNKWAALEEGLDVMGRQGWICLMDADVLWPKVIPLYGPWRGRETLLEQMDPNRPQEECIIDCDGIWPERYALEKGYLYTPLRRMLDPIPTPYSFLPERDWRKLPLHPNVGEFAGYSQIFHADDPVLGSPPWHETNWKHAGGADSFFQAKWAKENKVRPPFEVLHLGPAGKNWCGRSTPYVDGSPSHQDSMLRAARVREFMLGRRGKEGLSRYEHERTKDKE